MAQNVDTSFIPDLPKGPLCAYRKRVNFDWKHLRLIFENEQSLRIKVSNCFIQKFSSFFQVFICSIKFGKSWSMTRYSLSPFLLYPPTNKNAFVLCRPTV